MKKFIAMLLCLMLAVSGMAFAEPEANTLPLTQEKATLTMYMQIASGLQNLIDDYNESPTVQKMEELTNVHIDFVNPPVGDDGTFFNMLIASGEYPDIFVAADELGRDYPGQTDGAIEDKIVINPNELIEQYASNFMAMYNSLSDKDKLRFKTDGGVYKFGNQGSNVVKNKQHTGLIIRRDWLEALNLEMPQTYEDFANVLRAFKENYNTTVPFAFASFSDYYITNGNVLSSGYGVTWDTFILDEEGKVTHSYLQEGYKQYLSTLASWMKEGLIDVDNINRSHDDCKKLLYTGQAGVIEIGNWETNEVSQLGALEDEKFVIAPMNTLRQTGDEDKVLGFSNTMGNGSSSRYFVSTTCKDPVLAIKWIDNLYNPEINLLTTFGVGDLGDGNTTYVVDENGDYSYSDYMYNQPDFPFATFRLKHYIQNWTTQTLDSMELAQYNTQLNLDCWNEWTKNVDNSRLIPDPVSLTSDESRLVSETMTEIKTYMSELALKIICGEADLTAWDEAVAKLPGMGIDDAIAAEQAALDRYNAR